jgi:hypothetical protein
MHLGDGTWTVVCAAYGSGALAAGAAVGWAFARQMPRTLQRVSIAAGAALLLALTWFGLAEAIHHGLALFTVHAAAVESVTQAAALLMLGVPSVVWLRRRRNDSPAME